MGNKVYLITGASSDVGIAFLKSLDTQLKRKGERAEILAHYSTHNNMLLALQKESSALNIELLQADFAQSKAAEKLTAQAAEHFSCPDYILHLPASKLVYNKIKQFSWQDVLRDMEIQVHSLEEICRYFLPLMRKRGTGKVVVMLTSCTIGMPPGFMSQYVVVKYALLGLMKSLAAEYAGKGININGISPNMMETKFLENINEKIIALHRENSLLKRHIKPEEIIPAIHFLFSEGSDHMNGINLNLTGGEK